MTLACELSPPRPRHRVADSTGACGPLHTDLSPRPCRSSDRGRPGAACTSVSIPTRNSMFWLPSMRVDRPMAPTAWRTRPSDGPRRSGGRARHGAHRRWRRRTGRDAVADRRRNGTVSHPDAGTGSRQSAVCSPPCPARHSAHRRRQRPADERLDLREGRRDFRLLECGEVIRDGLIAGRPSAQHHPLPSEHPR